uniref:Uncharacterized protein n=1 Tax=Thermus tengchongensis TaxID=1214928 RepID=A0A7V4A0K5_9DEIN
MNGIRFRLGKKEPPWIFVNARGEVVGIEAAARYIARGIKFGKEDFTVSVVTPLPAREIVARGEEIRKALQDQVVRLVLGQAHETPIPWARRAPGWAVTALDRAIPEAAEARRRAFERWWETLFEAAAPGLVALETALLKWAANDLGLTKAETEALVRFQESLEEVGLHLPVANDDREIRGLLVGGNATSPVFLAWAWARRGSIYEEIEAKVGKGSKQVKLALRLLRWWRAGGTTETFILENPDLSVEEVGEVEAALLASEASYEEWMAGEEEEDQGEEGVLYTYEELLEERAQKEALRDALGILGLTPEEALRPEVFPKVRELTLALYPYELA